MKIDIVGEKFGRYTVLSRTRPIKNKPSKLVCLCDCGTVKELLKYDLVNGKTVSCGCYKKEQAAKRKFTHGKSKTVEHNTWLQIKHRCRNKNNKRWMDYGGRGINVCERWLNSFEDFYADMGDKPSPEYSIDRIDNNKDYSPDNCRWATPLQQTNNQRIHKTNKTGIGGVSKYRGKKWLVRIGYDYLGYFDNFFDACCARKSAENVKHRRIFCA